MQRTNITTFTVDSSRNMLFEDCANYLSIYKGDNYI